MSFQCWQIVLQDVPKNLEVDLIIVVDKNVSHLLNHLPRRLRMSLLEFWGNLVDYLSDNLDIVSDSMKMKRIIH